jgi:hypothetical protein
MFLASKQNKMISWLDKITHQLMFISSLAYANNVKISSYHDNTLVCKVSNVLTSERM